MAEFIEKVWGVEEVIANNDRYAGKILHLDKGSQCSLHEHRLKHETFYILSGIVRMQTGESVRNMYPGEAIVIEPNTLHSFTGLEHSRIIEFSTHDDPADSYRRSQSRRDVL